MARSKPHRIIVMTGATSGLGACALQQIAAEPFTRVIVGARGSEPAVPAGVRVLPLDLASLASVREFAELVTDQLGDSQIDILVLNAGLQSPSTEVKSADGYEMTFAVNHLAHYLLARLLLPRMADNGRLVITTSETHDPTISPLAPKSFEPQALARGSGSGIRAYAASKLANMLTAQSFSRLDEVKARGITVIAFSPGLTGGTSIGRDSPRVMRVLVTVLMHTVFRLIGLFRPEYVIGTPERSGAGLANVALGTVKPPHGRIYVSLIKGEPTFPDPSALAQNLDVQDRLWRESAAMVSLG